mgnify:CR=1 FL=1
MLRRNHHGGSTTTKSALTDYGPRNDTHSRTGRQPNETPCGNKAPVGNLAVTKSNGRITNTNNRENIQNWKLERNKMVKNHKEKDGEEGTRKTEDK